MEQFESIAKLYRKYLENTCTEEELDELLNKLGSDANELVARKVIAQHLETQSTESDQLYQQISDKVEHRLFPEIQRRASAKPARTPLLWPRLAGLAAAIALVVFGVYFYNFSGNAKLEKASMSAHDIAPGKVGATLTLASGKRIDLGGAGDGEIAQEAGIVISKSGDGQLIYTVKSGKSGSDKINTLSTAKGQTYMVVLPDQSRVWLNSASSLTYRADLLSGGVRKVTLSGEAYFEIAKDKQHPFIVDSKAQRVEVLGTHFNVNAYNDEPAITTTLVEGAVKVSSGSSHRLLKPGLQSIARGDHIEVAQANLEMITDWKNGDFNLDGLDFKSAMRKIARWYDIEVIYDQGVSDNIISGGWISRNTKLSTILEVIERSGLARFRLEGRKLYVSK
ncbi:FecR domain-containing protein [Pedobacter faecalis]|uniref:FecR domain-containing protein n=1 Tax=Pedobacter faecalis TaxID=3041495 RepID=UPI002550E4A4|nr:FecR domain-containing protein [Pedobacter sp. ELA7]